MTEQEAYIEAVEELGLDSPSQEIFDCAVDIYNDAHRNLKYIEARRAMKEWYDA